MEPTRFFFILLLLALISCNKETQVDPCASACSQSCIRSGKIAGSFEGLAVVREREIHVSLAGEEIVSDTSYSVMEEILLTRVDSNLYELQGGKACRILSVHDICRRFHWNSTDCSWGLNWRYDVDEKASIIYYPGSESLELSLLFEDVFGIEHYDNNGDFLYAEYRERSLDLTANRVN